MRNKLKSKRMIAAIVVVLVAGVGILTYEGVRALTMTTSTVSGKHNNKKYEWYTRYTYDVTEDDTTLSLMVTDATFTKKTGQNFGNIGRYMTCTMTFDGMVKNGAVPPTLVQQGVTTVKIFSGRVYSWEVGKSCADETRTLTCQTVIDNRSAWKGKSEGTEVIAVPARSKYEIFYDANGGRNAPAKNSGICSGCSSNIPDHGGKSHGIDFILSSECPTRDGYVFMGWATTQDALVAEYQPGDSYSVNEPLTLYALWEKEIVEYYYNFWFTV